MNKALATTGADLVDALTRFKVEMKARSAGTVARVIETGANLAASEPWRIGKIVYGRPEWPVTLDSREIGTNEALAVCLSKLAAERNLHATGHWCRDFNRLTALRQAERALLLLTEREGGK